MPDFKGSLKQAVISDVEQVLSDPTIPKLYANFFIGNVGTNDAMLVLQQGSTPIASVAFSHDTLFQLNELVGKLFLMVKELKGEHFINPSETAAKLLAMTGEQTKTK